MPKPVKGASSTKYTGKTADQLRKEEDERRKKEEEERKRREAAQKTAEQKRNELRAAQGLAPSVNISKPTPGATAQGAAVSGKQEAEKRAPFTTDANYQPVIRPYTPTGKAAVQAAQERKEALKERQIEARTKEVGKLPVKKSQLSQYTAPSANEQKKEQIDARKQQKGKYSGPAPKWEALSGLEYDATGKMTPSSKAEYMARRHNAPTAGAGLEGDWASMTDEERKEKLKGRTQTVDAYGNLRYDDIFIIHGRAVTVDDLIKQGYSEDMIQQLINATRQQRYSNDQVHNAASAMNPERFVGAANAYLAGHPEAALEALPTQLAEYETRLRRGSFDSKEEKANYTKEYQRTYDQYMQALLSSGSEYTASVLSKAEKELDDLKQGWDLIYSHGSEEQVKNLGEMQKHINQMEHRVEDLRRVKNAIDAKEAVDKVQQNGDEALMKQLDDARSAVVGNKAASVAAVFAKSNGDTYIPDEYDNRKTAQQLEIAVKAKGYTDEEIAAYSDYLRKKDYDKLFGPYLNWLNEKTPAGNPAHPVAGPAAAGLLSVASAPVRGATRLLTGAAGAEYGGTYADPGKLLTDVAKEGTEAAARNIEENIGGTGGKILSHVFQYSVSAAESFVMGVTMGPATSAVMGLNATADAYDNALSRGMSQKQAIALGITSGIFEALFEYLSLDKIKLFNSTKLKGFVGRAVMLLKSSGVEASEEVATDIANEIADLFIGGELSNFNEAMARGVTPAEYAKQFGLQLVDSAAGGAFSGAAFGMASAVTQHGLSGISTPYNDFKTGKNIQQQGDVTQVVSAAKASENKRTQRLGTKLEGEVQQGKTAARLTGKVYNRIQNESIYDAAKQRAYDLAAEQGVKLTEREADAIATAAQETRQNARKTADGRIVYTLSPGAETAVQDGIGQQVIEELTRSKRVAEWSEQTHEKLRDFAVTTGAATDADAVEQRINRSIDRKAPAVRKAIEEGKTYTLVENAYEGRYGGEDGASVQIGGIVDVKDGHLELAVDYDAASDVNPTAVFDATGKAGTVRSTDETVNRLLTALQNAINGTAQEENVATGSGTLFTGKKMTVEAANVALANFDPRVNTDVDAYVAGIYNAYKAGSSGVSLNGYLDIIRGNAAGVTLAQLRQAWRTGAAAFNPKPGVTRIGDKQLTEVQLTTLSSLDGELKKHGIAMVAVDHLDEDNGYYKRGSGVIVVALDADFDLSMTAAWHEAYHMVRTAQGEEEGAAFVDATLELFKADRGEKALQKTIDRKKEDYKKQGVTLTDAEAREEVAAQYFATLKTVDSMQLGEAFKGKRNLLEALRDALHGVLEAIRKGLLKLAVRDRSVYEALKSSADTMEKVLAQVDAALEQTQQARAKEIADRGETVRAEAWEGTEREAQGAEIVVTKKAANIKKGNGKTDTGVAVIDAGTESAAPSPMHSLRTWNESEYVQQREETIKAIMDATKADRETVEKYVDDIDSIAYMIANDRARLDYDAAPGRSVFVSNAEYGGSIDFSTLCAKRRLLTGTFQAIQNYLKDTVLTPEDVLKLRNMMKDRHYVVNCGLCYVEGSRAQMGVFAKQFIERYQKHFPDAAWVPDLYDVNTPDGVEQMRLNHPDVYEQYEKFWNNHGKLGEGDSNLFASQQKPKLYQTRTDYKGEILDFFKSSKEENDKVKTKNDNGGLRIQSFSDFELPHMIDMMQVIMDMYRVGLAGQAYTKVPEFAWALGNTGLKINLSLIAKGLNEDGTLAFDDTEGMPHEEAFRIRNAFSKNVGTILVVFDDAQLKAAMADPQIDFIIPFHRSQWKKAQYGDLGLPTSTKDFTRYQNEKYAIPKYHEFRGKMVREKAANYMPNTYWDFNKSGKENAQDYLDMCKADGKRPKFYQLLDKHADGSYSMKEDGSTDGYWKLLIDFKMYDNDGVGAKQEPVKPIFNMGNSGNADLDSHSISAILSDYEGGHQNFPVAQDVVKEFIKYKTGEEMADEGVAHSRRLDYDQPITRDDVADLKANTTDGQSISEFTQKEIDATYKWAYKYYQKMGIKSPFFRAWMDWRPYDKNPVIVASKKGIARGLTKNNDTGWNINVSGKVIAETTKQKSAIVKSAVPYLDYLDDIITNAILLDTKALGRSKRENSLFMHSLYAVSDIGNGPELLKLYVEEMYDPGANDDNFRAYQLQNIEKASAASVRVQASLSSSTNTANAVKTIADLYALVKQKDSKFKPGREVSPLVLNKNGTPKVFWHQTAADFTVFNTDNPVAGKNDSETPNGIFFKDNNHDIGIGGNRQMPVYLSIHNPLHFANREQANKWYRDQVDGYADLADAQKEALAPISAKMDVIEDQMFDDGVTTEEYETLDAEWNALLEEMRTTEDSYSAQMRSLLNHFFLETDSGYDGLILDDDGHRYVDGKREDVHTTIAFKNTQVKSAETGTEKENVGTFSRYDEDIRWSKRVTDARDRFEDETGGGAVSGMIDATLELLQKAHKELDKAQYDAWLQGEKTEGRMKTRRGVLGVVTQYNDPDLTGISNDELTDQIMSSLLDLRDYDYGADELVYTVLDVMATKAANQSEAVENETRDIIRGITNGSKFSIGDSAFNELVEMAGGRRALNDVFRRIYGFTLVPEREAEKRGAAASFESAMKQVTEALPGLFANTRNYFGFDTDNGSEANMAAALYEMRDSMQMIESETQAEKLGLDKMDPNSDEALEATQTLYERAYADAANFAEDLIRLTPLRTLADTYEGKMSELRQAAKGQLQARQKEINAIKEKIVTAEAGLTAAAEANEKATAETARMERRIENLQGQLAVAERDATRARDAGDAKAAELEAKAEKLRGQIGELRDRLQKERAKVKRRDAALVRAREDRDARLQAQREYYQDMRRRQAEKRRDTASRKHLREKLVRDVKWLRERLEAPTDQKHIPEALKKVVTPFVEAFLTNSQETGDRAVFTRDSIDRLLTFYERLNDQNQANEDNSAELATLYGLYDADVAEKLKSLKETLGGRRLSDLTATELRDMDDVIANLRHIVRDANSAFVNGKRIQFTDSGLRFMRETRDKKKNRNALAQKIKDGADGINVNMAKPIYLFKEVVGGEIRQYFDDIREAQDQWAFRIRASAEALAKIKKKYHFKDWSGKDSNVTLTLEDGTTAVLTKQAVMQIYATYKREMSLVTPSHHLTEGGIVLSEDLGDLQRKSAKKIRKEDATAEMIDSKAHPLTEEDLRTLFDTLTDDQRGYVDECVAYLSGPVAGWGNEASMELHGYKKFGQGYYFPFQSSDLYLRQSIGVGDDARIKNKGFTKALTPGANNPIVITGFDEVLAKHIGDMASYSTLAVPLENLNRLLNFKVDRSNSVRADLNDTYGKAVNSYIREFLTQMNGGVKVDKTENIAQKMMGRFKRAAVALNFSVMVQQPSAVARAMAMVNPQYFVRSTANWFDYRELMKYSGVAIVKQLGGWDTGTGRSTTDYLLGESSPEDKVTEWTGKGAEWADAMTWSHIWNAVKRETAHEMGITYHRKGMSEEFYRRAAQRFNEVADYTQVYDSTLSRSQWMRSQGTFMKMATAFMAEPTTSYNMLVFSGQKKNGRTINKGAAIGAFVCNVVLNTALQSLVGAWRDKDDKSYWERWFKHLIEGIFGTRENLFSDSEFFIPNMIPFVKDIISLFQGYDVERSDMTPISEIYKPLRKLIDGYINRDDDQAIFDYLYDNIELLAQLEMTLTNLTPLPMKSLYKDVWLGGKTAYEHAKDGNFHTTAQHIADIWNQNFKGEWDKNEQVYYAVLNKDKAMLDRMTKVTRADYEKYINDANDELAAEAHAVSLKTKQMHTRIAEALVQIDTRIEQAARAAYAGKLDKARRLVEAVTADGFDANDVYHAIELMGKELFPNDKEYADKITPYQLVTKDMVELAYFDGDAQVVKTLRDARIEQGTSADTVNDNIGDLIDDDYASGEITLAEAQKAYADMTTFNEKKIRDRLTKAAAAMKGNDGTLTYDAMKTVYQEIGVAEDKVGGEIGKLVVADYEAGKFAGKDAAVAEYMKQTGETDRETASLKFDYIDEKAKDEDYPLEYNEYATYRTKGIADSGITVDFYADYLTKISGMDANSATAKHNAFADSQKKFGNVQAQILPVINRMDLTPAQKDALFLAKWSSKNLPYAPWHNPGYWSGMLD